MKTWAKVLIGVLVLTITLETIYCFFIAKESTRQVAVLMLKTELAQKNAEKATAEADRQAELSAAEARKAQNEAERLMEELLECKSKK